VSIAFGGADIRGRKLTQRLRESDHTNDADTREHLTVVCFNSKGEGTTRHIPVSK